MIHIGYFSLLLFCISTNMIHSMEFKQELPYMPSNVFTPNTSPYSQLSTTRNSYPWNDNNFNKRNLANPMDFGGNPTLEELVNSAPSSSSRTPPERLNLSFLDSTTIPSAFDCPPSTSINIYNQFLSSKADNPYQGGTTQNTFFHPQPNRTYDSYSWNNNNFNKTNSANPMDFGGNPTLEELINLKTIPSDGFSITFPEQASPLLPSLDLITIFASSGNTCPHSQQQPKVIPKLYHMTPEELANSALSSSSRTITKKRKSALSDDEDSAVFDRESDEQETFISKQGPKKRQYLDSPFKQLKISDDYFYIIKCTCLKTQRAQSLSALLSNHKNHLKNHPSPKKHTKVPTPEKIGEYVRLNAQQPKKSLLYLIPCPKCNDHISCSTFSLSSLKNSLSTHLSNQHKDLPGKLSNSYIEKNVKIVIAKKKLSLKEINKLNKKTIYDVATFKALNNFDQIITLLPS